MLTYLIYVIGDLAAAAVLCGLALAYARFAYSDAGGPRIIGGAICAGVVLSVAMAVMKQTTNLIDTGTWNMVIFVVALVALVVFLVGFARPVASSKAGRRVGAGALALFVLLRVFYKLPDVLVYPFTINVSDGKYLSSDFVLRISGYLLGFVIVVLIGAALYKMLKDAQRRHVGIALAAVTVIIGIVQAMTLVQTLLARRIIPQNHDLFLVVKWFANSSTLFLGLILAAAAVLAVVVIVRSLRDDEPYANPAEHRRIKARWRNRRRWAACLLVCLVVALVTVTAVKDYVNRGPELSPSEECEMHDGNLYISLDQVSDGHLHRFTYQTEAGYECKSSKYTTQGGVGVRLIVIKKPGSNAYGIGLDACEICGETGYYERDGQVVCKLCDVVMNINTIGFKGGCNPIPIDYSISGGSIIVPTDGLSEYEKTFKSSKSQG